MADDEKSCTLCGSAFERPIASPFERVICLGYYDGPTSGLAQCANSFTAYRFELVAWDSQYENRIYSLAESGMTAFGLIVSILSRIEEPRWPFWMPPWQFHSAAEEESISMELNQALAAIPPPSLLIATDRIDKRILRCRRIRAAIRNHLPQSGSLPSPQQWRYWEEYLNLTDG